MIILGALFYLSIVINNLIIGYDQNNIYFQPNISFNFPYNIYKKDQTFLKLNYCQFSYAFEPYPISSRAKKYNKKVDVET